MREDPLDEAEALMRVRAAEKVKAEFPEAWVGVALSDENRSFEPWVIQARATSETVGHNQVAFSPLHQRPTSPMGQMGVEVGHVVVGRMCPGMFMGLYHPGGDDRLQDWAIEHKGMLTKYLKREIAKVNREIEARDVIAGVGVPRPSEEEIDAIIGHVSYFRDDLKKWLEKIEAGDLSMTPRTEN